MVVPQKNPAQTKGMTVKRWTGCIRGKLERGGEERSGFEGFEDCTEMIIKYLRRKKLQSGEMGMNWDGTNAEI